MLPQPGKNPSITDTLLPCICGGQTAFGCCPAVLPSWSMILAGSAMGEVARSDQEDAQNEREDLKILRELVKWENTNNEELLEKAREEIRRSWRETCEMNKGKEAYVEAGD
ncbi:MAG: hypothetical protein U5L00_00260 [Desulfovermiculus sp.]|nr:hypothetical protein [Desulfovermiculus sp.]